MKISWIVAVPLIVAATAAVAVFWSARASYGVAGLLMLAWWIAYLSSESPMDRAYNEYLYSDEEMQKEFMERASPGMRAEIEKRLKGRKMPKCDSETLNP
jgi:hypothetical protein